MKKIAALLLTVLIVSRAAAQFNFGIATSNYCSMTSLPLNPANIAGCKEHYEFNLFSFNAGVDNNVGAFNAANGLVVAVGNGKTNNMFSYSNNSKVSMLAPYVAFTGPGIMYRIDKHNTVAFTTGLRGMNQFNNFDQTIFHTFNDPKFRTTETIDANPRNFAYTVHLWSEFGITYATTLIDNKNSKLKVGATLRYLGGIAYVAVKGRSMDAHFSPGKDTFTVTNTDIEYASNILSSKAGAGENVSGNIASLLFNGNAGNGIGGDLGVVYEYTPKNERRSGYLVRFSASLMDVGSITYKGNNNAHEVFSGSGYVTGKGILDNVKNFGDIQKYASIRGFASTITKTTSTLQMPERLMLGGDYRIDKKYYVNVTYLRNLATRIDFGNSYYNQFTITPRYETKTISVGLPLTYNTLSNSFKVGVGVQASGLFIGFDDMLSLLSRSQYGLNFYAGLTVPIYK
jgi:hypothetical protein